jgi:hypothetical protein
VDVLTTHIFAVLSAHVWPNVEMVILTTKLEKNVIPLLLALTTMDANLTSNAKTVCVLLRQVPLQHLTKQLLLLQMEILLPRQLNLHVITSLLFHQLLELILLQRILQSS